MPPTFIPVLLLAASLLPSAVGAIEIQSLSSSLEIYKNHPLEFATDGEVDTYFSSSRNPKRGEWIHLATKGNLKGKNVIVHSGQANGKDKIHNAQLQTSQDGKQWKTIGNFRDGKAQGHIADDAKFIRIEFFADAWSWVAIREITIGDQPLTLKQSRKTIAIDGKTIQLAITVDIEGVEAQAKVVNYLIQRYFIEWPKIAAIIDAPLAKTPKHLYLKFDPKLDHPAHVSGTTMVISSRHLANHKADSYGVFTHELTHFVQNYAGKAPTWFSEGAADYVRFHLHKDSLWARQNLRHTRRDKPLGSYWSSTAFLIWLEKTYSKPVTAFVSRACSDGRYNEAIWQQVTGKPLEQLTHDYQQSPLILQEAKQQ